MNGHNSDAIGVEARGDSRTEAEVYDPPSPGGGSTVVNSGTDARGVTDRNVGIKGQPGMGDSRAERIERLARRGRRAGEFVGVVAGFSNLNPGLRRLLDAYGDSYGKHQNNGD